MAEETTGLTPFIQKPATGLTPFIQRPDPEETMDAAPAMAPEAVEDYAVVPLPDEDVMSETLPPLFSFGDKTLFRQKIEEKGIEGVTRDVVGIVKQQLPHFNFTYEDLKDGSADVLDLINPAGDLPTLSRAMTDEAILAMFTDLEDYGKYDPPVRKKNADGTFAVDEDGQPVYEDKNYNLSAIAGGARDTALEAGVTMLGGWQGARMGAAAYMARVPRYGLPGYGRALDVGPMAAAATVGAVVGAGILQPIAGYVNEWLFDEPDPIVVPSLQAAYNSGETAAYGITFLASPWVGTRLALKPLGEAFNAAKVLENFRTIASSKFKPDELIKLFGKDITERALGAAAVQASKGPVRRALTPNVAKGPTAARITDTIIRGGQNVLLEGAKNPKTFLGVEAIVAGGAGLAAYNAEKIAPGNELVRFGMELTSAPVSLLLVKPTLAVTQSTTNLLKSILSGEAGPKGQGMFSEAIKTEAGQRLTKELRGSPEYVGSKNPEQELDNLIEALLNAPKGDDAPLPTTVAREAGSVLSPAMDRTQAQLATRETDLAVATEKGREQFVADAKEAIMTLRQTNTPEGLQLAASIEQRIVEQEAIDMIEAANSKLISAAERVFGNEERIPQDAALGERFYDLQLKLVASLKQKRDQLYRAVPDFEVRQFTTADGTEVRQPNSLTIFDVPTSEGGLKFSSAGAKAEFNTLLGGYKDDFAAMGAYYNPKPNADGTVTAVDFPVQFSRLREMLSHFKSLKAARERVNPMDSMATHINSLIKAIDQDMTGMNADGVFKSTPGQVLTTNQAQIVEAYTKAKAFTYGMHNVISRTFVSETSKVNAQRGMVLDPLDAVKAVKVGDDIPLARINQMQEAVNFLRKEAGDIETISYVNKSTGQRYNDVKFDAQQTGTELNEVIELIIRDARKNIMDQKTDPVTGEIVRTVNLKKLDAYKNRPNSKALFAIFPAFARDLNDAESAQKLMLEATAQAAALRSTDAQKAFAWFLQRPESATKVVAQIIGGEGKIASRKALQTMVDKIKNKGSYTDTETGAVYTSAQVLDGLRAAISNYAVTRAGGSGHSFSPTVYYDTLFSDVANVDATSASGGLKLMDFMKANGMVDDAYIKNLQKAVDQMRNVEAGIASNELSGELFKRPSLASLGMLRVGGSMLAGASLARFKKLLGAVGLQDFGVGASITAGEEGAKAAMRFVTGPETLVINSMSRIFADPEMLALSIKQARTAAEFNENLSNMQKMLGAQTLRAGVKVERDVSSEESFIRPGEMGDREADYSKQRLAFPPAPQQPAPVQQQPVSPPSNIQGPTNPPNVAPTAMGGSATSPALQAPAAQQRPPVNQSGPVDRAKFAALFPEDRELMGIGSLMQGAQ